MQTSVAKKLFAVGLAASTLAWAAVPFTAMAAAHAEGTNIKDSSGTVSMIIGGQRRPYTSAGAFLSYGFNSWSSVVDANADDLALPVGSFIAPQDGTIFCATETKGSDVKGECSLITGGQKAAFTAASVFTGQGFSFSRAEYGDSSFLTKTSNIDSATAAHKAGVLVNNNGTVQLVGASGLLGVPDLATFNSWGYSFADVVPANAADKAMTQTGVMAARVAGQLSPTATASIPGVTGPVSVSLASTNPASGSVVASQAAADMAHFTFSGNGVVTGVTLKRTGISSDDTLSNVYLYEGAQRLTDAASVSSGGTINFANGNGIFTVNGSKTISVKADINASAAAGQTVGIQVTGATLSGNMVAGGVPVTANQMTVIGKPSTLAKVELQNVTPSSDDGTTDLTSDLVVWQATMSASQNVNFNRMTLREIGSAQSGDVNNFRLFIGGTQVAQTQSVDSNGYVTFAVSPVKYLASGTYTVKVLANVVSGPSRNFYFTMENQGDMGVVDAAYGIGIGVLPYGSSTFSAFKAGKFTINDVTTSGVVVQKTTDSPSGNVTLKQNDVTIGKWSMITYGEAVKLTKLTAGFQYNGATNNGGTLRNGKLLINGAQYGSTAGSLSATGTDFTLNYVVQPGTAVTVELHADMYKGDGSDLTGGNTIKAFLAQGSSNAQGQTSYETTNVPSSVSYANQVSVASTSASLAKQTNYASQTTVVPQNNYKLGVFSFTGSTSEEANVDTITVAFNNASTTMTDSFTFADLNNVYLMFNGQKLSTKTTVTATTTWSVSQAVAKGATVAIEVWGDIGSNVDNLDQLRTDMTVSGTGATSGQALSGFAAGQVITATTGGSVTESTGTGNPAAAIVAGNQTRTAAVFKFSATNDTFNITDLKFTITDASTIQTINVKDGNSVVATASGVSPVTFSNLSIPVPANGNKLLTVEYVLGNVGTGAGTAGSDAKITLVGAKYSSTAGTEDHMTSAISVPGNSMFVFKAVPTITNVSLPTGKLVNGTNVLDRFTISSTGTVSWKTIKFTIATSSGVSVTNPSLLVNGNTDSTITCAISGTTITCDSSVDQEPATSGTTYTLKANVTGATTSSYVTTSIQRGNTSDMTTSGANFVWSDESASGHTLTTSDWFGDNLVLNLSTDSQSLDYGN